MTERFFCVMRNESGQLAPLCGPYDGLVDAVQAHDQNLDYNRATAIDGYYHFCSFAVVGSKDDEQTAKWTDRIAKLKAALRRLE